jgi:hypothetical protein
MVVVATRESNEPQVVVIEQRRVIERSKAAAHFRRRQVTVVAVSHYDANLAAPAKWHENTAARTG